MSAKPELAIIDGTYYIFRAYFAIKQNLTNQKGVPTNAVYGFKNMLQQLTKEIKPSHLVVAFDAKGTSFRNEIYPQYKANRDEAPPDLISQIPVIIELVQLLQIKCLIIPGFEADDIIGTLVNKFKDIANITLVSADKDLTQLVTEDVIMFDSMRQTRFDPKMVKEKYGVFPELIPDFLGLKGDASDNIPGVKGIGDVGASKLLNQYPGMAALEKALPKIEGKNGEKLRENWDNFVLSRRLATINQEVPLQLNIDDFVPGKIDSANLAQFYEKYNFKPDAYLKNENAAAAVEQAEKSQASLGLTESAAKKTAKPVVISSEIEKNPLFDYSKFLVINKEADLENYIKKACQTKELCLDFETTSLDTNDAVIVGIALKSATQPAVYIPCGHNEDTAQIKAEVALKIIAPFFADSSNKFIAHNIKYELLILKNYQQKVTCQLHDSCIIGSLIESSLSSYSLDSMVKYYFAHDNIKFEDVAGKGQSQVLFNEVPIAQALNYAGEDAEVTFALFKKIEPILHSENLLAVYKLEMETLLVLVEMESRGILIDAKYYSDYSKELKLELVQLESKIQDLAPEKFNINSPKQLSTILFEKLGIAEERIKTKTGFSTDQQVLEKLSGKYEIASLVLLYRLRQKLINTYLDVLPKLINKKTGRIHTSYSQTVAATGRLSSSNPNLQNIPIRGEERAKLREGFVAASGCNLITADYSQIELRVLAHLSKDPGLLQAFKDDQDIHTIAAAKLFNLKPEQVDSEKRAIAKSINFGLIYGMGAHRLSGQINVSYAEAKSYIEQYFNQFSGIKQYLSQVVEQAHKNEYVDIFAGRKRYLPLINSKSFQAKSGAERIAMNTPIQGQAAYIIKLAMIKLQELLNQNFENQVDRPRILLQVHDELVLEAQIADTPLAVKLLTNAMEQAIKLDVPLKVNVGVGANWSEAAK